jgi:hypothetical protein
MGFLLQCRLKVFLLERSLLKREARRFSVDSPPPLPSCESPLKITAAGYKYPYSQGGLEIHRAVGIGKTWCIRTRLLLIPATQ